MLVRSARPRGLTIAGRTPGRRSLRLLLITRHLEGVGFAQMKDHGRPGGYSTGTILPVANSCWPRNETQLLGCLRTPSPSIVTTAPGVKGWRQTTGHTDKKLTGRKVRV